MVQEPGPDGQVRQFEEQVAVWQTPRRQDEQVRGHGRQLVPSYRYPFMHPRHLEKLQEVQPAGQQKELIRV